jgi:uncharacterized peroxidase-related enzyme
LHHRSRRDPAHLCEESADRRSGRDQFRGADISERQKAMLEFAVKVATRSSEIIDADYDVLRHYGFSDEDIWDIGAIAAFFALSNRMADVIDMRPNDEFYTLGRQAKAK